MTRKMSIEKRREKRKEMFKKLGKAICPICKNEFQKYRRWQKFCSDKCRFVLWQKNKRIANIEYEEKIMNTIKKNKEMEKNDE